MNGSYRLVVDIPAFGCLQREPHRFGIVPTSMESHWLGTKGAPPPIPSLPVPLKWAKSLFQLLFLYWSSTHFGDYWLDVLDILVWSEVAFRDFPGDQGAMTPSSQCRSPVWSLVRELILPTCHNSRPCMLQLKILLQWRFLPATTKTWHSQRKK